MTTDIIQAATLGEVLRAHAAARPAQVAYTFLVDGEDEEQRITFGELDRKARLFALELTRYAGRGDRAILLYPSGLEFVVAFLGCLYAGVVAVPANVPHLKRDAPRLKLILQDAQPLVACAPAGFQEKAEALSDKYPEFERLQWISHEQIQFDASPHGALPEVRPDDLAFLQYTSGSTSAPRGVMLTHSNLLYSVVDCLPSTHQGEAFRMVSWLPIFHDMGLIYGLLTPLYAGGECILMSPVAFLEKPYRWLCAATKHRGTHVAAPNFAYDLCATHITPEQKQSLDLANLVSAVNGAEPVRLSTMQAFAAAFAACGFRFECFGPSYGLAESTVKVTSRRVSMPFSVASLDAEGIKQDRLRFVADDDPKAYHSVGCGWTHIGADIRIVQPEKRTECGADEIGEIWVSSKAVGKGYWNRPDDTRTTFGAYLADEATGPFLRTGDLGFIYKGQLHVVGRIKDMLIVNGRNYHPQDIELTVEQAHPGLRPSCGAAFSVDDGGTERLVVVQEVRREFRKSTEFEAMSNAIRMAIAREHGLRADAVVLIMPSRIPKTTSGKIQRHAAREEYLRGALEPLYEWHAPRKKG